ncbi:sigma-70 family RNA polymerase sigma factor [Isoptericola aurantiacus]|uniref:sigma-70 family RNA polymerase sigma factor n=1 Tax=Isoptericola aurantiacus TaxID=3377839 RepID=UPI00383B1445
MTSDAVLADLGRVAFGVAYRMLGSVADAEDVAQETLVRMSDADRTGPVDRPAAYATTVAGRLALDELRSARARRERYVGPWLPEPLVGAVGPAVAVGSVAGDGAAQAELAEDVSVAFLVLLETLAPRERAAFVLHDVLGHPHQVVADALGTSVPAARQVASRARRKVAAVRGDDVGPAPAAARAVVERFRDAIATGDAEVLLEVLDAGVSFTGDGDGNVPPGLSVSKPVGGSVPVARLLAGFVRRGAPARLEVGDVGGRPGLLAFADESVGGGLVGVYAVAVTGGRVVAVHGVLNPDKLGHTGPLADLDRFAAGFSARRDRSPRA